MKSTDDGATWAYDSQAGSPGADFYAFGDRRLGGIDADDMYIVAGDNGVWHRSPEGGSFSQVIAAAGHHYYSVFAIAADDVWVVGSETGVPGGAVRHWNGSIWENFSAASRLPMAGIGDTNRHLCVWASGPNDVWVVGERDSSGPAPLNMGGYVIHTADGGTTWTDRTPVGGMPSGATGPAKNELAHSIWGFGPDDVWMCGDLESGPFAFVMQWTGSGWVDKSDAALNAAGVSFGSITGRSASDIWVASYDSEMVAHFDGAAWTVIATPVGSTWGNYAALALDGDKEVWFGAWDNGNTENIIQSNRPPVTAFTNRHNSFIVSSVIPASLWAPDLPPGPSAPTEPALGNPSFEVGGGNRGEANAWTRSNP